MISHALAHPHLTPALTVKIKGRRLSNRHYPYDLETPLLAVAHVIRFVRDSGRVAASIWTKIPSR
jgi:hypothetical protein